MEAVGFFTQRSIVAMIQSAYRCPETFSGARALSSSFIGSRCGTIELKGSCTLQFKVSNPSSSHTTFTLTSVGSNLTSQATFSLRQPISAVYVHKRRVQARHTEVSAISTPESNSNEQNVL